MRNLFRLSSIVCLILLCPFCGIAQKNIIDSLQKKLLDTEVITKRIEVLNAIGFAYRREDPTQGIKYAQKALTLAKKNKLKLSEADAQATLGILQVRMRKYPAAQQHLKESERIFQQKKDARGLAKVYFYWGSYYMEQAKYKEAIKQYEQALQWNKNELKAGLTATQKRLNLETKADIWNDWGYVHDMQGDFPKAIEYYKKAFNVYLQLNNNQKIAAGYINLGQLLEVTGKVGEALEYIQKGLKISKAIKNTHYQSILMNAQARIYENQGEYAEALEMYKATLVLNEQLKDETGRALTLLNIGNVFCRTQKYEEAAVHYRKTLAIAKKSKDQRTMNFARDNLAQVHLKQKNYDKALKIYQKGVEYYKQTGDIKSEAMSRANIGGIFEKQGNLQRAYDNLLASYRTFIKIKDQYNVANVANVLSDVLRKLGKYEQAQQHLQAGQKAAQQVKAKSLLMENYRQQFALDSVLKNYEAAIKNYQHYTRLSNEINDLKKARHLDFLRVKLGLATKEQEAQKNAKEAMMANQKARHNQWMVYWLAGSIFLVVVLVAIAFKWQRSLRRKSLLLDEAQRQLLKEKIERKNVEEQILQEQLYMGQQENEKLQDAMVVRNHELTKQALYLIQKKQLLDTLESELCALIKQSESSTKKQLKQLVQMIHNDLAETEEWENFKQTFEIAHPYFYQKLQNKHPELTLYELKLCALLKLNFNIKELANILNITPESVARARSRLRKKLGLTDENLNEFMMSV